MHAGPACCNPSCDGLVCTPDSSGTAQKQRVGEAWWGCGISVPFLQLRTPRVRGGDEPFPGAVANRGLQGRAMPTGLQAWARQPSSAVLRFEDAGLVPSSLPSPLEEEVIRCAAA